MSILFKNTALPVSDVDTSKGIVTLYASAFGNVDSDNDVIEKGAFTKSINEWGPQGKGRIKHLWMHSVYEPIGRPVEMIEDVKGLLVQSKVSDVKNGDYLKLYADGVITEHSIGFEVMKSNETKQARIITETRLWEYSSVTWGANPNTPTVGMKSQSKEERIESLFTRFDTLTKAFARGTYTDDTFQLLGVELAMIKEEIAALVKAQPTASVTESDEPQFTIDILKLYNEIQ